MTNSAPTFSNFTNTGSVGYYTSVSDWTNGSGGKYWNVSFSTIGISNMKLSSQQRSSGTGPRDFKIQYSSDGSTWVDVPTAIVAITTANNFTVGALNNIALPVSLNNQPLVHLRWIMTSNTSVNGSNVAGTGSSSIDEIVVTGDQGTFSTNPVSGSPFTITAPATSFNVTGLNANSNYTYTVKAVNGSVTSTASNIIEVTTLGIPTWNGTAWSNTTGPDATTPAVIDGDYAGPAFTAQSLTVNAGKTLTVTDYVLAGNVTNNGAIIVEDNANFVNTGTFTKGEGSVFNLKRNSKDVSRLDYIAWSSPVKGAQKLIEFSPDTLASRFLTYNGGVYNKVADVNSPFVRAQGYLIRTPNNFATAPEVAVFNGVFTGDEPNTGAIEYDASGITGNYVFLGNPYPGALDIEKFYVQNNQITGSFYIWNSSSKMDGNGNYSGSNYNTYTKTGSVPATAAEGYIPAGQGFFVDRGETGIAFFKFDDTMRATAATGVFAKSNANRFWLNLITPDYKSSQMLIGFAENGTIGIDKGLDGKMMDSNADVLYSVVDSQDLIIDTRGTFTDAAQISISAKVRAAGSYTIGLAKTDGIFTETQKIYLKDNATGVVTDLSAGSYAFNAETGVHADRFTIIFKPSGVLSTDVVAQAPVIVYSIGKEIHIKSEQAVVSVEVYEMTGRLIASLNPGRTEFALKADYTGSVVVRLKLKDGKILNKKLMLK